MYTASAGAASGYYMYSVLAAELPADLRAMRDPAKRASRVYSADGELIGEYFLEKRIEVPLGQVPAHVQQAFIAAEDRRFWEHPGFDFLGIARAAYVNWTRKGKAQGASTITQQVTRMMLLTTEKTYIRKAKELILSVRVEAELSKRDILELYLNRVYLGHGSYGVQAAAEIYFGKSVTDLTLAEATLIAGLPQAPSDYSPHTRLSAARARQRYVLDRMRADGYVSDEEFADALAEPLALIDPDVPLNHLAAPYFVEHVRRWVTLTYGNQKVFDGGLRIYTTLDMRAQRSAEAAVRDGLESFDRLIGFRGPIGHVDDEELASRTEGPPRPYLPGLADVVLSQGSALLDDVAYVGVVVDMDKRDKVLVDAGPVTLPMMRDDAKALLRWRSDDAAKTTLAVGDLIPVKIAEDRKHEVVFSLSQNPEVQGSLVALDPSSGRVKALVGGYSFAQSKLNRVTQSNRPIGSTIKPFIYVTALEKGLTQMDVLVDRPMAVRTASGVWRPQNYTGDYQGAMTLRTALAKSVNTISVQLLLRVGVESLIDTMRSLGITIGDKIPHNASIALGTAEPTLMEVVTAYSAFPNGGMQVRPRFVDLITTDDGKILADFRKQGSGGRRALPADLSYIIVDMMKAVVERGTGRRALALGRPAAGKTGTSNEHRDAWFIGYTRDLLAGVWMGRDDYKPIGGRATGGTAALPIWLQFMLAAHPETPPRDFEVPDSISFVRVNEMTGQPVPAGSSAGRWIPFARGSVPARLSGATKLSSFEFSKDLDPEAGASKVVPGPSATDDDVLP